MKTGKIIRSHDCLIIRPPISMSWNSTSWSFPINNSIPCQRLFRTIDRACFLRRGTPNAFRGCVALRTSFGKTDTKTVLRRLSVFSTFSDFSLRVDERRDPRLSSSRRHTLTSSSLPSQSPSIFASKSKSWWHKRKFFCKWVETDVYNASYNVSS